MNAKELTLSSKLVIAGIGAVLIPVLIIGYFVVERASGNQEKSSRNDAMLAARSVADMVEVAFAGEFKVVQELAVGNTTVDVATAAARGESKDKEAEIQRLNRKLAAAMKQIGKDYEVIFAADLQGNIYADGLGGTYKGISVADRDYFKTAKDGKVNVGKVVRSKKTGNPIAVVGAPIVSNSGECVGILAVVLKVDFLIQKLSAIKVGETGYTYMVDSDGLCIAHPDKKLVLNANIKELKGMEVIAPKILAHETGIEYYTFQGKEKIAAFAPIPLTGWSVISTQEKVEFMQPVHDLRMGILWIGFILLVLTSAVITFLARRISIPITRIVGGLSHAAVMVAASSSQMQSASQELADGAAHQASAIEETSSSLEEMSSMTRQNAENAGEANRLMNEADRIVNAASQSMQRLTSFMSEISRSSEETQKIIKTIDEIAFQTNLLALNAAVEAARAGEAGAGFAVVADEVRNLAMRAAEAAKNTAELIEGTVKNIRDGNGFVEKTNQEFIDMAKTVTRSGELVSEISEASNEQAQGIGQVNKAVAEVDKVIQQNASNAEEAAAASTEMNSQAERMKGFVKELVALVGGGAEPEETGKNGRKVYVTRSTVVKQPGRTQLAAPDKGNGRSARGQGAGAALALKSPVKELRPEEVLPFDDGDFKDF